MIYLSAQPDTNYFIWQLEIQLKNFEEFKIDPNHIHVLVSFDVDRGVNPEFLFFAENNSHLCRFFFYPDIRKSKEYEPSIRPHIIKQHFIENSTLCSENIFYHDSDIIFTTQLPDFERLCRDEIWYFSDTRRYVNADHINNAGAGLLKAMCNVLNIDPKIVEHNNQNSGGAQALIKKVDSDFWGQIEVDCVNLYNYIQSSIPYYRKKFYQESQNYGQKYIPISSWCSDMWALLWNAFKIAQVRIDEDLDFCWPHNVTSRWYKTKIFHNAGINHNESNKFFYKTHYMNISPYDKNFDFVSKNLCSYKYIEKIKDYADNLIYVSDDATFLITVRSNDVYQVENLKNTLKYLISKIRSKILIIEYGSTRKILDSDIPIGVDYSFEEDEENFSCISFANKVSKLIKTPIIVKYDCDAIIPCSQIHKAILSIRSKRSLICYPHNKQFVSANDTLKKYFSVSYDVRIFDKYFRSSTADTPSLNGCIVIDKTAYIRMLMLGIKFRDSRLEDRAINICASILELKYERIKGPIYYLESRQSEYSLYSNERLKVEDYSRYLQVCAITKKEYDNLF